ncbi:MAG: hypothetical protein ACP5G8_04765 [Athalassotoga sp.]
MSIKEKLDDLEIGGTITYRCGYKEYTEEYKITKVSKNLFNIVNIKINQSMEDIIAFIAEHNCI